MNVGAISSLAEGLTLPLAIQGAFKPPSAISRTRYVDAIRRVRTPERSPASEQPRASASAQARAEGVSVSAMRAYQAAAGVQANADGDSFTPTASGTAVSTNATTTLTAGASASWARPGTLDLVA